MHVYTQDFERLLGRSIVLWIGLEMAAGQGESAVWTDSSCVFLQFYGLQLHFSDKTMKRNVMTRIGLALVLFTCITAWLMFSMDMRVVRIRAYWS